MAKVRFNSGRPLTVSPLRGGESGFQIGQRWRMVGLSMIDVWSSNTKTPWKLLA
jgi:hypothetical protein